jgi:predicted Zn-dependent protease
VGGITLEMQDSIARCLIQLGKASCSDADAIMTDMKSTARSKALVHALLNARLLRSAGKTREALEASQEACSLHPVDPMGWVNLAEAYRVAEPQSKSAPVLAR